MSGRFHHAIRVAISGTSTETTLLVKDGPNEMMIARLGAQRWADHPALSALMEALALWFQRRICVALSAASEEIASSTGPSMALAAGRG